ncbi:MAG: DUF1905 domain-containing protein [Rhizobiaceae bacterium]
MFEFDSHLWEWGGKGGWHFVTVPEDISGIIRMSTPQKTGFGSVRVSAAIGGHKWKTSLFPDAKSGCYFLPVKAEIRRRCEIFAGARITVFIETGI